MLKILSIGTVLMYCLLVGVSMFRCFKTTRAVIERDHSGFRSSTHFLPMDLVSFYVCFVSAQSNVTVASATSTSQVQIRRFSQTDNPAEVITVPVTGPNGTG